MTLQSLFTWIFYLFKLLEERLKWLEKASILIHLDFLSISIINSWQDVFEIASILIHLDFLSIWIYKEHYEGITKCFNPYSPGFSIYLKTKEDKIMCIISFNPYSPGFSIYLLRYLLLRWRRRKLQSLFTWIFYLFGIGWRSSVWNWMLQSLFTWIFYLFRQ